MAQEITLRTEAGLTPQLPQWAVSRAASLNGTISKPTIRQALTVSEREQISRSICLAEASLLVTPLQNTDAGKAMFVLIKKLIDRFPSQQATEDTREARTEGYVDALEDLPIWATQEAIRKWHRAECGKHDYTWAPSPGVLRIVANGIHWRVKNEITSLSRLLLAEVEVPVEPLTDEQREWRAAEMNKVVEAFRRAASCDPIVDLRKQASRMNANRTLKVLAEVSAKKRNDDQPRTETTNA